MKKMKKVYMLQRDDEWHSDTLIGLGCWTNKADVVKVRDDYNADQNTFIPVIVIEIDVNS